MAVAEFTCATVVAFASPVRPVANDRNLIGTGRVILNMIFIWPDVNMASRSSCLACQPTGLAMHCLVQMRAVAPFTEP